ncbi:MAG TPA: formate dehydrogenase accessory protein FdhE [Pyrinomonadaceae bacterium]|nr:formate dehydrogenase accessory protein FdhE [Pyrinomonadaceae bacterium]
MDHSLTLDFWERQTARAIELADTVTGATELLVFYGRLLRAQTQVYQHCIAHRQDLSGELEADLATLRPAFATILSTTEVAGPEHLVEQARELKSSTTDEIDHLLLSYWAEPSDTEFFAKAFLQPYGQYVSSTSPRLYSGAHVAEWRCPLCGGKPQLSILEQKESGAESGNRDLMCAKCVSFWPFRRAVCAHCGEEEPTKLARYDSPAFNHVRVEACETCKHYLKNIDWTRTRKAEAMVDEVAAAALDLWAVEHGYTKIELNLVGL